VRGRGDQPFASLLDFAAILSGSGEKIQEIVGFGEHPSLGRLFRGNLYVAVFDNRIMPRVYVAMLRGINVGGHNKVPMKDLAVMFADAGCDRVQTYIQSGNVIFQAAAATAGKVHDAVGALMRKKLGLEVPIVLRSAEEMVAVAGENPFLLAGAPEDEVHVSFLAAVPEKGRVDLLEADRSPPDEFRVIGREIYLRLPNTVAKTKLTNAYFDSKLKTVSTQRNWRTVLKLVELTRASTLAEKKKQS
jgi:uncharacterized protein (DUF1697 family)